MPLKTISIGGHWLFGLAVIVGSGSPASAATVAGLWPQEPGPGYAQAASAYAKYARRDFAGAAADARIATRTEPDNEAYWSLLSTSLRESGDRAGALGALVEQERRFGTSGVNSLDQAYLLAADQPDQAIARFLTALSLGSLADEQSRPARLTLADLLISQGEPQQAFGIMSPIDDGSYASDMKIGAALSALGRSREAAVRYGRAAGSASDGPGRDFASRSAVLAHIQSEDLSDARDLILEVRLAGAYEPVEAGSWASLAISAGDDVSAQAFLSQADTSTDFTRQSALDAGYSAKRLGLDGRAIEYFTRGLVLDDTTVPPLSQGERLALQRDIAELSRIWGGSALFSYGANDTSFAGTIPNTGTDTVSQLGGEVFRRLGGYRNGRPLEVFARTFQTVSAEPVGDRGFDTTQGWLGVRWKPLTEANIIVEASRMVALGESARDDWMVRAAFSVSQGLDIQPERRSWPMMSVYGDVSRILDAEQTLGTLEARAGWSYRPIASKPLFIVSPFASANLGYDSLAREPEAVGVGGGVSLRQWLGGSEFVAPYRYLELVVQSRARATGADRAAGTFITLSLVF